MLYYWGPGGEQRHYDADDNYRGRTVRGHPILRVLWLLIICTVTAGWPLIFGDSYLGLTLLALWLSFLTALALARMAGQGGTSAPARPERPQTARSAPRSYRMSEPGPRDWTPAKPPEEDDK